MLVSTLSEGDALKWSFSIYPGFTVWSQGTYEDQFDQPCHSKRLLDGGGINYEAFSVMTEPANANAMHCRVKGNNWLKM